MNPIRRSITNLCSRLTNKDQLINRIMQAVKSSVKTIRKKAVCGLLMKLKRQDVGTNDVEFGLKKTLGALSEAARKVVRRKVMSTKIVDSFRKCRASQIENSKIWKAVKREIPWNVREGYLQLWRQHTTTIRQKLEKKHDQKVEWLRKKWKCEDIVPGVVRGVTVEDGDIPQEFQSNPRIYGSVLLDEDEKKAMQLSPKFGLYRKLDVTRSKIDVEESLNKLRWNRLYPDNAGGGDNQGHDANGDTDSHMFNDTGSRWVDINTLRTTDLPYNPQVKMPPALQEGEVQLHQFKSEVDNLVRGMRRRTSEWSNLDESAKRGLEKLKKRVTTGEIVCFVTDKSGRWAVDTPENYKRACEAELSNEDKTPESSIEEHDVAEKEMNCQALAFLRMMGINDDENSGQRVQNAMTAHGVKIPPFYGMRKDHKGVEVGQEESGPRVRPVCGAKDSGTKRLSYVLCLMLSRLIPGNDTNCESTEELLREFEKVNRERVIQEKWVVGSLDVDALYPSLDIERCAEVVCRKLYESDIVLKDLVQREIVLYLRFHLSDEVLVQKGYDKFCPRRRHKTGKPTFYSSGSNKKAEVRYGPWVFPRAKPSSLMIRKMFCSAIEVMIVKTMSMHDFQFDGKIYRQKTGGSIGLDLTGVISDVYMCEWDRLLIQQMEGSGMDVVLYKRYKDDVNFVADAGQIGAGQVCQTDSEREVMECVKFMAESIDPNLTVSTDVCGKYPDRRLPILDIKVWIGEDSGGTVRIMHTHYMKDVSSRLVMSAESSHGDSMRMNVMVNELVRVMRNCSVYLEWENEAAPHLTYFMRRMQWCGYTFRQRYDVLRRALVRYDERMRVYMEKGTMFVEPSGRKRGKKSMDWYKCNGKYESVVFVEATPDSELKSKVERLVRKHKLKMLVVERAGSSTKAVLQKSDPFRHQQCGRDRCVTCNNGDVIDCRTRGCVYEIECKDCERKYRGTTGRSLYERIGEHASKWEKQESECPLMRHSILFHSHRTFDFEVKVLSNCYGKPSRRLITEAVHIHELGEDETMNSKSEWSYVELDKVRVA